MSRSASWAQSGQPHSGRHTSARPAARASGRNRARDYPAPGRAAWSFRRRVTVFARRPAMVSQVTGGEQQRLFRRGFRSTSPRSWPRPQFPASFRRSGWATTSSLSAGLDVTAAIDLGATTVIARETSSSCSPGPGRSSPKSVLRAPPSMLHIGPTWSTSGPGFRQPTAPGLATSTGSLPIPTPWPSASWTSAGRGRAWSRATITSPSRPRRAARAAERTRPVTRITDGSQDGLVQWKCRARGQRSVPINPGRCDGDTTRQRRPHARTGWATPRRRRRSNSPAFADAGQGMVAALLLRARMREVRLNLGDRKESTT